MYLWVLDHTLSLLPCSGKGADLLSPGFSPGFAS